MGLLKRRSMKPVAGNKSVLRGPVRGSLKASKGMYSSSSLSVGTPEIRDPMFTPEAFYVMNSDIKTMNKWIRYYDKYHPILPNSLDIHTLFPISDFSFKGVTDPSIKDFYDYLKNEVLFLLDWVIKISSEYERFGEAFTFFSWDAYNGYFNSAVVLNPDLLELSSFDMDGQRKFVISMDIPESFDHLMHMKDIDQRYRGLWNNLDPVIRRCVEGGLPIPLNPANVFGMQRLQSAYDTRGTSQVLRCFVEGTKVFVGDGTLKNIEEVSCSDSCWTIDGKLSPVTDTVCLDHSDGLIDILLDSSENPIQCTPDHKFPVYITGRYCQECGKELSFAQYKKGINVCSRSCNALKSSIFRKQPSSIVNPSGIVWRTAGELKEGDLLVSSRQPDSGFNPVSLDMARLLGYFLAEGCYAKGRKNKYSGLNFSFCLDEKDTWVSDVVSILKDMGISTSVYKDRDNGLRVSTRNSVKSYSLVSWMLSYAGEYCHSKKLSADVFTWSLDLQKEILKGFCRGDGSVSTYPELSCVSVSFNLISQLSRIALNLGLPHRLKTQKKRNTKHLDAYWLLFPGSVNRSFIDECFPDQVRVVNEAGVAAFDVIRKLKDKGLTIKAIASKLNSDSLFKLNGKHWDVVAVSRALTSGAYGIKGKGKHTHFSVTDKYILSPIRKISRRAWSGKVYCVTVKDPTHSFSLNTVCTHNCLKDLMYEDKLREAQMAVADGHITPYQLWKLGNSVSGYVPTQDELENFSSLLNQSDHQNLFRIVTHSDVTYETKGVQDGLLNIIAEMDKIEDRILTALYTSRSMTTGEGPTYSNAVIGLKVLEGRYQHKLYKISGIIRALYRKIAEANEIYEPLTVAQSNNGIRPSKKDRKLMVPSVHWDNYFSFSKDIERAKFYLTLAQAHKVSFRRVLEILGLDFDEEQAIMQKDLKSLFETPIYEKKMKELTGDGGVGGGGVPTDLTAPPSGPMGDAGAEIPDGASAPPLPDMEDI